MKVTNVFTKHQAATAKIVVSRGGARSSKSYSIAQWLSLRFLQGKGLKILVLRKTLPALRLSTYPLLKEIWSDIGVIDRIKEEKQFLNYYAGSNYLHMGSLDDPEKIKSTDWSYIWMEEANEFTYDDYMVLKLRLSAPIKESSYWMADPQLGKKVRMEARNQLIMSFNPVSAYSWMKTRVVDEVAEDRIEIVSKFTDNPFLSRDYIETLLAIKNQNLNYYQIYALGEYGVLEELIYTNWLECDVMEGGDIIYGLDFGFNAESALTEIRLKDNEPYVRELLYKTGLTNNDLITRLEELKISKSAELYCDTAEPARIEELSRAGYNVFPSDKSVKDGIDYVKSQKIHVTKDSPNIWNEYHSYSYKKTKDGHVLDEPVKFHDHLLDTIRYSLYTHSKKSEPQLYWA